MILLSKFGGHGEEQGSSTCQLLNYQEELNIVDVGHTFVNTNIFLIDQQLLYCKNVPSAIAFWYLNKGTRLRLYGCLHKRLDCI